MTGTRPICDYEDSDYRTRFWEGQGREYEDAAERIAIRRLLPPTGDLLLDLGAGYGRLAELYRGYRRVVLFDYSRSQLSHARSQLGDARFVYVAGDFYRLPFPPGLFDSVIQVRVIHHAVDAPAVFDQVRRVLRPVGLYLLEYANKQNLKAIIRYLLQRQTWSPFDLGPRPMARPPRTTHCSLARHATPHSPPLRPCSRASPRPMGLWSVPAAAGGGRSVMGFTTLEPDPMRLPAASSRCGWPALAVHRRPTMVTAVFGAPASSSTAVPS